MFCFTGISNSIDVLLAVCDENKATVDRKMIVFEIDNEYISICSCLL